MFEAVGRGSLILIPLLHFHPGAASTLFAHLLPLSPDQIYGAVTRLTPHLFAVSGAVLAVITAHHLGGWAEGTPGHAQVALEIAALAALFALAQPLIAFVVYFCVWHSFRASLRQAAKLDSSSPRAALHAFARHAWPTTVAAFLMGAIGYALAGDQSSDTKIIQVVFVGLSALTAPHILFSWLAARHARMSPNAGTR
jgi:Brp/Blh family beta-carotene 15,15'-monooxygenase